MVLDFRVPSWLPHQQLRDWYFWYFWYFYMYHLARVLCNSHGSYSMGVLVGQPPHNRPLVNIWGHNSSKSLSIMTLVTDQTVNCTSKLRTTLAQHAWQNGLREGWPIGRVKHPDGLNCFASESTSTLSIGLGNQIGTFSLTQPDSKLYHRSCDEIHHDFYSILLTASKSKTVQSQEIRLRYTTSYHKLPWNLLVQYSRC